MLPKLHLLKTSRCHFGGQNNHAAKITSTCFLLGKWVNVILAGKIIMPPNFHLLKTSRCNFGGKIIMPPKLRLLILLGKQVDVILAGKK